MYDSKIRLKIGTDKIFASSSSNSFQAKDMAASVDARCGKKFRHSASIQSTCFYHQGQLRGGVLVFGWRGFGRRRCYFIHAHQFEYFGLEGGEREGQRVREGRREREGEEED